MASITHRRLRLVRHAKAVEESIGGDHTRPLNPRGREDAAALGRWLAQFPPPELVLCSTATRTRETLGLLGHNFPTILRDKLYLASAPALLAEIHECDDAITDLMIVAHNPGLHGLLALLVGEYADEADADRVIMKFPTSTCAELLFDAAHWRELAPQSGFLRQLRWTSDV